MANGNLSHSMRENYGTHGVAEYYKIVQESCAFRVLCLRAHAANSRLLLQIEILTFLA